MSDGDIGDDDDDDEMYCYFSFFFFFLNEAFGVGCWQAATLLQCTSSPRSGLEVLRGGPRANV